MATTEPAELDIDGITLLSEEEYIGEVELMDEGREALLPI